jgi:hypothetical protein
MEQNVFELLRQLQATQSSESSDNVQYREPVTVETPPDPTKISSYSAAIKYISKYVSRDESTLHRIRQMIQDQERHERDWFEERQKILRRQTTRQQSQKELASVLKLVGADIGQDSLEDQPQANARELENYDQKVYKSAEVLVANHKEQLREMRIPLFCFDSPSGTVAEQKSLKDDQQKLVQFLKDLSE